MRRVRVGWSLKLVTSLSLLFGRLMPQGRARDASCVRAVPALSSSSHDTQRLYRFAVSLASQMVCKGTENGAGYLAAE